MVFPPPEKPLARIRLCQWEDSCIHSEQQDHLEDTQRINISAFPVTDDSTQVSVMKRTSDHGANNLELEVMVEADGDHASDGEDGLACCACKQAAGMLQVYEEDGQLLPGDGDHQSDGDENELTSKDMDMIHNAERFAQQQDEAVTDSEDGSDNDDASDESSDEDDDTDGDYIPRLKLKGRNKSNTFKAKGGRTRAQRVDNYTNYTFCPLLHRLSILRMLCKRFCQHPILPERHGQTRTPKQIHRDAVLEAYYHCKANNLREV